MDLLLVLTGPRCRILDVGKVVRPEWLLLLVVAPNETTSAVVVSSLYSFCAGVSKVLTVVMSYMFLMFEIL